ncbi:hypothetical protein XELAEV_18035940mg [Xenopus laevis]|uniref:Uncharacterized protein n=1 Tax=Xenopus laevis TaxID=8355 RepID=A0A974CGE7_XENLA|nr:hypothetical protein XELAEV_18035940mg [Xenopus laevis]
MFFCIPLVWVRLLPLLLSPVLIVASHVILLHIRAHWGSKVATGLPRAWPVKHNIFRYKWMCNCPFSSYC